MYWVASTGWAIAIVLSAGIWLPMNLEKSIRLIVMLALTIGVGIFAFEKIDEIRESYQDPSKVLKKTWIGGEDVAHKNACEQMNKQSEQFQGWSVLILTGIVAILVTTKVHRLRHFGWAYVALGPAAMFLVASLRAGSIFSRRYAHIVAKNNFDILTLSALGEIQSDLFLYSIICVSVFAGYFLICIVLERVEPFEEKKGAS